MFHSILASFAPVFVGSLSLAGRQNGEQGHVAGVKVAATALVDSGATSQIVNDEKLVAQKSYKVDT